MFEVVNRLDSALMEHFLSSKEEQVANVILRISYKSTADCVKFQGLSKLFLRYVGRTMLEVIEKIKL